MAKNMTHLKIFSKNLIQNWSRFGQKKYSQTICFLKISLYIAVLWAPKNAIFEYILCGKKSFSIFKFDFMNLLINSFFFVKNFFNPNSSFQFQKKNKTKNKKVAFQLSKMKTFSTKIFFTIQKLKQPQQCHS